MGYAILGIGLLSVSIVGICLRSDALLHEGGTALLLWVMGVAGSASAAAGAMRTHSVWILWAAFGLRALTFFGGPLLSDDVFRYIHEGRATRMGIDIPYTIAPSQVVPLPDDGTTARVNHPDIRAVYPPFAQELLWGAVAFGDGVGAPLLGLRLLWFMLDGWLLYFFWRRRGRRPHAFGMYAFHVLPILEASLELHMDIVGATLCFIAWVHRDKARQAGALWGLAAGIKPVAAFALVGLWRTPRRLRLATFFFILGVGVPTLPYWVQGVPLTDGLRAYGTRWQANPTLYALAEHAVSPPFLRRQARGKWTHLHVSASPFGIWLEEGHRTVFAWGSARAVEDPWLIDQRLIARLLCAALFLLCWVLLLSRCACSGKRILWTWLVFWLLTPTLYPWYLLWLLPFGAWFGSASIWLGCASAPLLHQPAFARAIDGAWHEALWPRIIFLLSLGGGALWDWHRARKKVAVDTAGLATTRPQQSTGD